MTRQVATLELQAHIEQLKKDLDAAEREFEQSVKGMQADADTLDFDAAKAEARELGQELDKALDGGGGGGGGTGGGGKLGRISNGLGKVTKGFGVASAAVTTFVVAFRTTREVIDGLKEISGGLLDVDKAAQNALGSVIEIFSPAVRNEAEAQAITIRALNQAGIEYENTVEGIAAGQRELERRWRESAGEANRYQGFLEKLNEAQAGISTEDLIEDLDELVFVFGEAEKRGDDLLNGPLGPEFSKQVLAAGEALAKMRAGLSETASDEDRARIEELSAQFLELQNRAKVAAASQQELSESTREVAETAREATEETEKATFAYAEFQEALESGGKAVGQAYREARQEIAQTIQAIESQPRETPEARDAQRTVEGLEKQKAELEGLQETQALTLDQSTRLLDLDGEIADAKQNLADTIQEQAQATANAADRTDLFNAAQEASNRVVDEARSQIAQLRNTYEGLGDKALEEADRIVDAFEAQDAVYRTSGTQLDNLNAQLQNQFDQARRAAEAQQRAADAAKKLGDESATAAEKGQGAGEVFDESGKKVSDFGDSAQDAADSAENLADEVKRAGEETRKLDEGDQIERYAKGWKQANEDVTEHIALLDQVNEKLAQTNALLGA